MTLSYRGPLLRLHFSDLIEPVPGRDGVEEMAQHIADWFSHGIRQSPVDWHMMQPVFTSDLGRGSVRRHQFSDVVRTTL
ncbi:MAG: hypothetical protein WKF73_17945 [Nocardioidaceae bacterium]